MSQTLLKFYILTLVVPFLSACTFVPVTPISENTPASPDIIAKNIQENNFTALEKTWQELDIIPKDYFFRDRNKLSFSVQQFYFEGNQGDEYAMLIIRENEFEWDWQYLLFRKDEIEWKALGNIDLAMQKYSVEPSYRVIASNQQDIWLVVRSLTGSGTGFSLYEEIWYRLTGEELEEVLRYPVGGTIALPGGFASLELDGEVGPHWQNGDTYTIAISFEPSYWGHGEKGEYPLFSMKQMAYYNWSPEHNRFLLNLEESEITQEQIDREFYYYYEDLLKYSNTYEKLIELARSGGKKQKEWLTKLLEDVDDSPEKENLLKIMDTP
ncbi:MAG: hypothetical protein GY797_36590 [Deltaproteobacteria bacterium]|nr:hypothetical protein [Deltaproteobacteria bacterium]